MGDFNEILQIEERKGVTSLPASSDEFKSRIDRVLVNVEWAEKFPDIRLKGGPRGSSDHCPLIVEGPLRQWHKNIFRDTDKRLVTFEVEITRLDNLVSHEIYDGTTEARRKMLVNFCEKWYIRKEIHWKQMSWSQHAADMDKNTRYFHTIASARRRSNRIEALMVHGRLVRNQARIKGAIRGFYKELYHQEYAPRIGVRDGLVKQISRDQMRL
ncbi:uncharacterized protein [Arachis hypogaea]|uniref:uncharacterized protein n=1 Tax=Arachis hypogaea TaxID=3818 RepID=UPI003B228387